MRKGFSLITAVFIMVLMATVSAFILNLSGKITQDTTSQYRQEQSALLARSYTELAIMAVMNHNRALTGTCIENIDGKINNLIINGGAGVAGTGYSVETRIYYLGNNLPCSNTRRLNDNVAFSATPILEDYNNTAAPAADALAAILIDVYVNYTDPDVPTFDITYHRRTLQKI